MAVYVAEGSPMVPLTALVDRITQTVHEDALRKFGEAHCSFWAFTREEVEGYGDREDFERIMRTNLHLAESEVEGYLASWDECRRPVAVIHTQPGPLLN